MKKLLRNAKQAFGISLVILGLSLLFTKTIIGPMFGTVVLGLAFVFAAWFYSRSGKKRRKQDDEYFF